MEARIISSGEGKVMGVTGGAGGGVGVMESSGSVAHPKGGSLSG